MKFSIITCTYNSEEYLQKNIDSVESQTFKDFEHIFIDGFSSDKTVNIIKKYQKKYPDKVKLFQSKPRGISHAMNEGIKRARGMYINHLHSDDSLSNENVLNNVANFLKSNDEPDWIYGKVRIVNVKNQETKIVPSQKICTKARFWSLLLLDDYIPHPSVFLKKSIFEEYSTFDENLKNAMDYDLWLKLLKNNVQAKFMDKIIANFSIREDAQSVVGRGDNENDVLYKRYVNNFLVASALSLFNKIYKIILHKISVYKI